MADFINTVDLLGDNAVIDSIMDGTISEFKDNVITTVGAYGFSGCASLETVDVPNVTNILFNAFDGCSALKSFDFDAVTNIERNAFANAFDGAALYISSNPSLQYTAFMNCKMRTLYAPNLTSVPLQGFNYCRNLIKAELPKCSSLDNNSFGNNTSLEYLDVLGGHIDGNFFSASTKLKTFIVRTTSGPSTLKSDTLNNTMIGKGEGYIYVPRALIEDYKVATNWSTYADQFRPLEDYTVDGTTTGEFISFTREFVSHLIDV